MMVDYVQFIELLLVAEVQAKEKVAVVPQQKSKLRLN
jgi:hypothetical protein